MNNIYNLSISLKEAIINSQTYKDTLYAEKLMNESENVIRLAYIKSQKENMYSDLLKYYKEDSDEVRHAQKELFIAKKNIEELKEVKDYLRCYQKLRMMLDEVNNELFKGFSLNLCGKNENC